MDLIKEGFELILKGLSEKFNLDITDENFRETPERVSRAYDEIFSGLINTKEQINEVLKKSFPCSFSEMIIAKNIKVFSMCPHHFLPVQYTIHVSYIPETGGRVLGISKLSRIVEILAKRPVLQEQLVDDVTECLMGIDKVSGAACVSSGVHFCMAMRGVKQYESDTIMSSLKGIFRQDSHKGAAARSEFMSLIK